MYWYTFHLLERGVIGAHLVHVLYHVEQESIQEQDHAVWHVVGANSALLQEELLLSQTSATHWLV